MDHVEKTIRVKVPVSTAYNQWTQFESFPHFMEGVKEVRQLDNTHVHWRAEIGGKEVEWDAEITQQVPDQRIAWRSTSGADNAGEVSFKPVSGDSTEVRLWMAYDPKGLTENLGSNLGVVSSRIGDSLDRFKEFIEQRQTSTGAWRGEVSSFRAN